MQDGSSLLTDFYSHKREKIVSVGNSCGAPGRRGVKGIKTEGPRKKR